MPGRLLFSGCRAARLSHCDDFGFQLTSKFLRNTSSFAKAQPRRKTHYTRVSHSQTYAPGGLRSMGSTSEKPEWDAVRVRDTFLDYFKKNGHTFGGFISAAKNAQLRLYAD